MIWVSRLTLIAYCVGGWLLPATHYHAHHDHGARHHAHCHVEATQSAAICEQSEVDNSRRCCGHTDQCETASDAPQHATVEYFWAASQQIACSGLCALCSARLLTSTTLRHKATAFALRDLSQSVVRPETTLLPCSAAGEHFSRGPPEIV
jgi:hypothetical protein